jgi:hypothetical protein
VKVVSLGVRTGTDRDLNGYPWHLNGQPQEPKNRSLLGPEVAPYGTKRHILWLRICTFTAWSENGHPYVARTLWSWDLATPEVRTGFLEARSGSLRKLLTAVPKIPLPWLHLRLSGVRIDFIWTRSCNLSLQWLKDT